jgi:hypothetical protein
LAEAGITSGASANLKAIIETIKQKVQETGKLYEDPEFPATDASLYKDSTNLPEYTKDCPDVDWKRPNELIPVKHNAIIFRMHNLWSKESIQETSFREY